MEKKREEEEEENLEKKNIHDNADVNPEKIEKTIKSTTTTTTTTTMRRRAWEDLPHHLLELFLKPISETIDRPNLSRVCKAWREFKPPCFPSLVHGCTISGLIRGIDEVDEYPIKSCLGSSHGWLIIRMKKKKYDRYHPKELYYLLNIFTKDTIQLPILWNIIPSCPKICLSSAPTDPDCIVLLFDDVFRGFRFSKRGCNQWIECKYLFNSKPAEIDEYYIRYSVIPFGGKFYALGYRGNLVVIDVNHHHHHHDLTTATATANTPLTVLPVNGIFPSKNIGFDWFLIESLGKLLVVNLYRNEKAKDITNLSVFELDFETMTWITMKNLPGDQVLFIGSRSSFSISRTKIGIGSNISSSSSEGGDNCIYVSDDVLGKTHRYDMHNQELMVCTGFPDSKAFDKYSMFWVKPTSV